MNSGFIEFCVAVWMLSHALGSRIPNPMNNLGAGGVAVARARRPRRSRIFDNTTLKQLL